MLVKVSGASLSINILNKDKNLVNSICHAREGGHPFADDTIGLKSQEDSNPKDGFPPSRERQIKYFEKEYALDDAPANNTENAIANIKKQFAKTGNTIFEIGNIQIVSENPSFVSISKLNEIRRNFLEEYEAYILDIYSRKSVERNSPIAKYFQENIDYQANVANSLSRKVYESAGVKNIEPAFELQKDFDGKIVMTTKHCLKYSAGICPKYQKADKNISEPLYLEGAGHKYTLEFDCKVCEMRVKR